MSLLHYDSSNQELLVEFFEASRCYTRHGTTCMCNKKHSDITTLWALVLDRMNTCAKRDCDGRE